jgi:hypothetical protein
MFGKFNLFSLPETSGSNLTSAYRRKFLVDYNINPGGDIFAILPDAKAEPTLTEGEVIAIDGKCLRRSLDKASKKAAIYRVSCCLY